VPELYEELLEIAGRLETIAEAGQDASVRLPIGALEKAATAAGKAWSGSWLGYQAYVYYANLEPPPPGAHFSSEWGFKQLRSIRTTTGHWKECNPDELKKAIYNKAGNINLDAARKFSERASVDFDNDKSAVLSILTTVLSEASDAFLEGLKGEAEKLF
jgi:hypothetical protein